MNITLIRHASVEERYLGCYNGHIDISLSTQGLDDAKSLKLPHDAKEYDAIYCSDLKRAKQTSDALGLKNVIFTKELREKSWGDNEGKSFKEIDIEYKNFAQFIDALGGESKEVFIQRVRSFFMELHLRRGVARNNILIITHAGVIKTLLSLHENITLENAFSKSLPYLSITRIKLENI